MILAFRISRIEEHVLGAAALRAPGVASDVDERQEVSGGLSTCGNYSLAL